MAVTDNFNRADSTSLGANWTVHQGGLEIVTNEAKAVVNGITVERYNAASFANDQYSQTKHTGGTLIEGAAVRCDLADTGDSYVGFGATLDFFTIARYDNNSKTDLAFTAEFATNNAILKLTVTGTSLELLQDGVSKVTTTDATYASGAAGIVTLATGATLDDWEGGDIGAAAAGFRIRRRRLLGIGA